ncbi:heat-inducible transcriptional repressor HrcA [Candidatus Cloacimonadota bacterium]
MKKNEIRMNDVLRFSVEEYIHTKEPVSSKLICEKYIKATSPATIRIDLNKLEKSNYIYQPHTSAGRVPTIAGYRRYLELISDEIRDLEFDKPELLRNILVKHYKDTALALHYVMQLLAKETDQLSFVAEPEVSNGYLEKLDVFKIAGKKLLFVVSLDSGLDKTVILRNDHDIGEQQLRAMVRYINDEFAGHRIYDIQTKYIDETSEKLTPENKILRSFLDELYKAIFQISSYYIHFDGNISFLEQPEFDEKSAVLTFLGFIQRHDSLINLMQKFDDGSPYHVLMGEDFGAPTLVDYALIYAKYEIFGIPGYLGILGPKRMNYKKNIPIIKGVSEIITNTTKSGMVVLNNGEAK